MIFYPQVEMVHWVNRINATTESASPRRSQTLPVRTEEQKESKKKRLFTMKKKIETNLFEAFQLFFFFFFRKDI